MWPGRFVLNVRKHVCHSLAKSSAIRESEREQIVLGGAKRLADGCQSSHIKQSVVVGLGAPELFRKASIWSDLVGNEYRFETIVAVTQQLLVTRKCCKLRNLSYPPGAVVVFGVALILSILRSS